MFKVEFPNLSPVMVLPVLPAGRGPGSEKAGAEGVAFEPETAGVAEPPEEEAVVLVDELETLNDCWPTVPVPLLVCACSAAVHNNAAAPRVIETQILRMTVFLVSSLRKFAFCPFRPFNTHTLPSAGTRSRMSGDIANSEVYYRVAEWTLRHKKPFIALGRSAKLFI
jgi:hypothetical protein